MSRVFFRDHEGEEKTPGAFGVGRSDLDEDDVEAKTETLEIFLPPKKESGKILQGELSDQVKELVQLLRNEAKVI